MKASVTGHLPKQDGFIQSEEYSSKHTADQQSGLVIVSSRGELISGGAGNFNPSQESFVSFDDQYIYCGIRAKISSENIKPIDKSNLGKVYPVTLSLGFTPGEHPTSRCSLWTNTFYFSAENGNCVGISGERIARSVNQESEIALRISNTNEMYRENGYVDAGGVLWNADHYGEKSGFTIFTSFENTTIVFETVIPLGDALLSVPSSMRESIRKQIKEKSGVLCGSFCSEFGISSEGDRLVLGVSTKSICPYSEKTENWKDYIKSNYETPISGVFLPDFLPIPLYWLGEIPAGSTNNNDGKAESETATTSSTMAASSSTAKNSTTSKRDTEPTKTSEVVKNETLGTLSFDESIFSELPNAGDMIPEDTEIVFDSDEEKEETDSGGSVFGSILTFLAGVFLFAAMIVLVFFIRKDTEEKTENTQKKNKVKKSKK